MTTEEAWSAPSGGRAKQRRPRTASTG